MPEKDFSQKIHKLVTDADVLVQQVQESVTRIVADVTSIKDSIDEVREKFKKPEENEDG